MWNSKLNSSKKISHQFRTRSKFHFPMQYSISFTFLKSDCPYLFQFQLYSQCQYKIQLIVMNEIDIMQQNLAKLLSEHLSLPTLEVNQPTDPFQKRQFGKKMKKSTVSVADEMQYRTASLPKLDESSLRIRQVLPVIARQTYVEQPKYSQEREQSNDEADMYMREIEVLISRLKINLDRAEESCKERMQRVCSSNTGKQRQQKAEMILGELEASVDFIINDCLVFDAKCPNQNRQGHDKENRKSSSNTLAKSKQTQKQEKSIYESVLEQRKLRRSKKRMI